MNQVATRVLRLRDAYRRASAMMPAVGLNPFDHPVDFNEFRLPDLVSFFTYIFEELSHLLAMVGAELPSPLSGESFQGSITEIHSCHWTPSLTS